MCVSTYIYMCASIFSQNVYINTHVCMRKSYFLSGLDVYGRCKNAIRTFNADGCVGGVINRGSV